MAKENKLELKKVSERACARAPDDDEDIKELALDWEWVTLL